MKKRLTALGLTVGLVGGGAAGLALGVPSLSSAQSGGSDSTTTSPPTTAGSGSDTTTPTPTAKPDRTKWVQDALAPLVTAGTLTQAQADAVAQALQAAKPAGGPGHDGRGRRGFGGMSLDTAAAAIGVTADELRQAIAGGQSIADFATSKNVEPQKVIDALVAETKTRLDQAVTDSKLTQAEADTQLVEATARITSLVNGTLKADFGGHRDRGPKGTPDTTTPSTTTPTTTTG